MEYIIRVCNHCDDQFFTKQMIPGCSFSTGWMISGVHLNMCDSNQCLLLYSYRPAEEGISQQLPVRSRIVVVVEGMLRWFNHFILSRGCLIVISIVPVLLARLVLFYVAGGWIIIVIEACVAQASCFCCATNNDSFLLDGGGWNWNSGVQNYFILVTEWTEAAAAMVHNLLTNWLTCRRSLLSSAFPHLVTWIMSDWRQGRQS